MECRSEFVVGSYRKSEGRNKRTNEPVTYHNLELVDVAGGGIFPASWRGEGAPPVVGERIAGVGEFRVWNRSISLDLTAFEVVKVTTASVVKAA